MSEQITIPMLVNATCEQAQKQLDKIDISPLMLLGEIFYPFSGIDAPVIHALPANSPGSTATKILQALLVHFALPENLDELPDDCQEEVLPLLGYLLKQMEVVGRYSELAFDCANMYKLASNKVKRGKTMIGDFDGWYFT